MEKSKKSLPWSDGLTTRRGFLRQAALLTGGALLTCHLGRPRRLTAQTADAPEALTAGHWGMVIDLAKFQEQGLLERVTAACHLHHNVPRVPEPGHEIKWIWAEAFAACFPDLASAYTGAASRDLATPVLCNHCENPACVRVCPTKATFQRPDGIVGMDYHRCIGCRFCMAGCPFGARSFNFQDPRLYLAEVNTVFPTRTTGGVEKCTFCAERLDQGQLPLCVEASAGAIVFGDLTDPGSAARAILAREFSLRRHVALGTGPSVYYVGMA
jgi:molybdopterin-containing oxidoreductase family iron-sulfur binding subunit